MSLAAATSLSWRPLPMAAVSSVSRRFLSTVNLVPPFATCSCLARHTCPCPCTSRTSSGGLCTSTLRNSLWSPFGDVRLANPGASFQTRNSKRKTCRPPMIRAGMRLDPGGGKNNSGDGVGRVVVNLVLASGLTYLTVTGKLGWVFDAVISLWLLAVLIPVISLVAVFWFAEREIVKGACPNCGQSFQAFEFALKQQQQNLCPYCAQPFKLDSDKQFVRDEPRFSNQRNGGFREDFGGFGGFGGRASNPRNQDPGGVIVDIEAEVTDRD